MLDSGKMQLRRPFLCKVESGQILPRQLEGGDRAFGFLTCRGHFSGQVAIKRQGN